MGLERSGFAVGLFLFLPHFFARFLEAGARCVSNDPNGRVTFCHLTDRDPATQVFGETDNGQWLSSLRHWGIPDMADN